VEILEAYMGLLKMNLERFRSQEGSWICSSDDRRRLRARDEANAMGYREPYVN
jgi:hypothetical protein